MPISNVLSFRKLDVTDKKGIIFDLDGTLADSMSYWCDRKRWSGVSFEDKLKALHDLYRDEITPFPFVIELLSKLHLEGVPMGILSATPVSCYEPFIKKYSLDLLVDFYMDCEQWGGEKISGEPYYYAAKKLYLDPKDIIVFEDYPSAALAAAEAGLCVVGVYESLSCNSLPEMKHYCSEYIYNFGKILKR